MMDFIWSVITVFGLVSMSILVIGIWTHLDMRKKQREEELAAGAKSGNKPQAAGDTLI